MCRPVCVSPAVVSTTRSFRRDRLARQPAASSVSPWLHANLSVECVAIRELGLQRASDSEIFTAARARHAVVMTKDADFLKLLEESGPPPQVILVTCGNTSNDRLRQIVSATWAAVRALLEAGEPLVELSGPLN